MQCMLKTAGNNRHTHLTKSIETQHTELKNPLTSNTNQICMSNTE